MQTATTLQPVAADVTPAQYVEHLSRVSRETSLGVTVTLDGDRVRFTGPTGEHAVGVTPDDRYSAVQRVQMHAEGFFGATRERNRLLCSSALAVAS